VYRRSGVLACLLLAVAVIPLAGQEAESLYASGERAFRDGLYLMAARSLRQLAEKYPDHPLADDAEYLEALAEYYQQGYARLLAILKDFPRRHPRSPFLAQVPFWLGSAHFQLGQYGEAAVQLATQAEKFPAEKEYADRALLLRGAALEKLGEWAEARKTYRRLLDGKTAEGGLRAAESLEAEAWFRMGSAQLMLQDYAGALISFTRVLVEHADSPQAEEALFYAAESLFFAGRFAEAERRYRLALEGDPPPERIETCLYRLARILARLEKPAEALAMAGELERRFPRGPYTSEYPLLAAEALFDLGRFGEAQTAYRRALAAAATPADRQRLSYSLALAALAAGTPEAALEALRDSLAGGDAGVAEQAAFRLAAALTALGRETEALKAVSGFRQRFPGSRLAAEALALEASLLDRAGRGREARELYTQLLARYPDSDRQDEVLFQRAYSFLAAGDTGSALKDFFAVVRDHPGSAYLEESRYNIGHIYSQRGEFARALPYFAEVVRQAGVKREAVKREAAKREAAPLGELAERAMLASGVCQFNAGEYAEALVWFQRLAELPGEAELQAQGWYYAGRALYKLERLAEAEGALSRAARAGGPQREEALYWQAVSLFRLDRLGAARQAFLDLSNAFPTGPWAAEAIYRAGMCAALGGEHPAALALFERALAAARKRESAGPGRELLQEILLQKGLSLLASSGREEAAAAFRTLAREFPGGDLAADGFLALAEADLRAGDYPKALASFRQLAKDYPGRRAARGAQYFAGVAAARQGLAEEGLEHLLRYLEQDPGGGLARSAEEEIRRILAETADPSDRALKGFLARVEAAGVPPSLKQKARFEYARHVFQRDREQGLALLSALRDSQPEEPLAGEVHYWIGEAYRQRGDLVRALDIFAGIAAARADRMGALAQAGVARVRGEQGRREEAAEEYLKLYFLYPELKDLASEGLYQAGRLYRELGLRERADLLFEKLRTEFPEREVK
jgi:TolA-binding protein